MSAGSTVLAPTLAAAAVLSRTLVKNSAGTVTLFSFGQGQVEIVEAEVPPHLVGRSVSQVSVPGEIIVVAITRDGEAFLPILGSEFRPRDVVQFAVHASAMERLEILLGLKGG